jgi:hypothetical protein
MKYDGFGYGNDGGAGHWSGNGTGGGGYDRRGTVKSPVGFQGGGLGGGTGLMNGDGQGKGNYSDPNDSDRGNFYLPDFVDNIQFKVEDVS